MLDKTKCYQKTNGRQDRDVDTYSIRMQAFPYVFCPFERSVGGADVDDSKVVNGVHRFIGFVSSLQTAVVLVKDEMLSFIPCLRVWEVVCVSVKALRTGFPHGSSHCVR